MIETKVVKTNTTGTGSTNEETHLICETLVKYEGSVLKKKHLMN